MRRPGPNQHLDYDVLEEQQRYTQYKTKHTQAIHMTFRTYCVISPPVTSVPQFIFKTHTDRQE